MRNVVQCQMLSGKLPCHPAILLSENMRRKSSAQLLKDPCSMTSSAQFTSAHRTSGPLTKVLIERLDVAEAVNNYKQFGLIAK